MTQKIRQASRAPKLAGRGSRGPEHPRDRLIDAAFRQFVRVGPENVTFVEICEEAAVPRATAYRIFPQGLQGLVQSIHAATVDEMVDAVKMRINALDAPVSFDDAVHEGVLAVIDALRGTPWISRVLRSDWNMMSAYLLNRDEGSVLDVLATYAARCAANFGSLRTDLKDDACKFVWNLFSDMLAEFPPPADKESLWPDPEIKPMMKRRLEQFVTDVGFPPGHSKQRRLPLGLPVIEAPTDRTRTRLLVPLGSFTR